MQKSLTLSLVFLAALTLPGLAATPVVAPKILVMDKTGILSLSKVGQDVTRQAQSYLVQAKADLTAQAKALQVQEQALQQQVAILAPDVRAKKVQEFQAKQEALQALATRKEQAIQYGVYVANAAIAQKVGPILKQLMAERGANLILDHSAVVSGTDSSMDITQTVIERLNQQLLTLKVTPTAPPAGTR